MFNNCTPMVKNPPLSAKQQLRAVVSGFDLAQSIAFGVMKQQFIAQEGQEHLMPLFEDEIKKALVGM